MIPFGFYLGIPSTLWNFDGVACAAALELGQPAHFFHADHLLYAFFGYGFWKLIGVHLGLVRALPSLQIFTSLLSVLGLIGVFRLVRSFLKDEVISLLLTLTLSVTAAFWVWSIEAQVYALGFLALAWATFVLTDHQIHNKYIWVGLLHAGAVLGHLRHLLWVFPALYWMWGVPKAVRRYVTTLFLGTVLPYTWVFASVIAPGRDPAHLLLWLKGSAGLTADRSWAWHSAGWMGPWIWLKSTAPALWGIFWPYGSTRVVPWMWAMAIISMALFVGVLACSLRHWSDQVARFAWLWIGVYGLFLSTWEPATLCYRMTDIIPLGILLALGLRPLTRPRQLSIVSLLLCSTLMLNVFTRILPMHDATQNTAYQETLSLSKINPPNSLYIVSGGLSLIYLPYFAGREAWNAGSFDPKWLASEIARQKRTRPVYLQKGTAWQKAV